MFTINIAKSNQSLEIDFAKLPEASQQYIIAYGLKQSLNDSAASAKNASEAEGMVNKRLDAILEGTVGQRGSAERMTPLQTKAMQIARVAVKAALKAQNKTADKETLEAMVAKHAQNEKIIELAKAQLAAASDLSIEL